MRAFGIFFFFLGGLTQCMGQARSTPVPTGSARPDVFLVTIDTLRADHVHCYGYDRVDTPALDSLAKDGVRFTQAFTPSPITNSSHTSILTGLLPSSHGVTDFGIPLFSEHVTWAELLQQQGYQTAAFIGAVILDSQALAPGLDRGFDFYDNFPEHSTSKSRWGRVERRGMEVVQHAESWLDRHRTAPRFVWVHLYDPHDPYEPPAPYSETYKDRLYDGEVAYADSALAHFIAYLKKQGAYDNTLLVVVGDHGEGLGEHQEQTHGIFLYDTTTHVPLIVKLPQQRATGKVINMQVRTIDILPTIVDLLGEAVPARFDGESLRASLAGTDAANRPAVGETDYPLRFGWAPLRSLRDGGFKFIQAPRPELYDLQSDPKELQSKYAPDSPIAQKLQTQLAELSHKPKDKAPADAESSSLPDPKDKIEEQNLLHDAMLASENEEPERARIALEKVLALDPKSPTALQQLGQLQLAAKNYEKAAGYLNRALEARPNDALAAFSLAQALDLSGDAAGARNALETTLKLNPSQFSARLLLGQIELKLNHLEAAADQLEAALLLQPANPQAKISLGEVLIMQKKFSEAVQQLEPLGRTQPSQQVYELLSKAYTGLGKPEAARRAQTRAKALSNGTKP